MSGVWRKTLIYLGLVEEPEEHDDLPEQFAPADDPSPAQPGPGATRQAADDAADLTGTDRGGPAPGRRPRDRESTRAPETATPRTERRPQRQASDDDASNVRPLRVPEPGASHVRAMAGYTAARVAVVHVSSFDHVEDVGARYRGGQPVLFDLSTAGADDARRVLDFVSGTTYALRGRLRRAGTRAFLLVPEGVGVPTDERERLAGLGYSVGPETEE